MTKKYGISIDVPRRARKCFSCKELFASESFYHSLITQEENPEEKSEICRYDYCMSCWKTCDKPVYLTFWKGQIPKKLDRKERDRQKMENAFEIMKEAVIEDSDDSKIEAFVLALFLLRKKHLIFRKEVEIDGEQVLLYESAITEEMIPIKKVDLAKIPVEEVQKQISEKLLL